MGSPPAQGGVQILGNFTFLGVDVSVTMLDKFQQSMLEKLEVPRIQFLDRKVDIRLPDWFRHAYFQYHAGVRLSSWFG